MTDVVLDKLIPFIRFARKLSACDADQRVNVLSKLRPIFNSHYVIVDLQYLYRNDVDTILNNLLNQDFYRALSAEIYRDIESILPTDDQLTLRDSIYESQLIETPEYSNEGEHEDAVNQREKKIPLTLLRVPTDVQCHLFQFLNHRQLMKVQQVCRALCIAARNPLSLYSFCFDPNCPKHNENVLNECYSSPKLLYCIDGATWPCARGTEAYRQSVVAVGNTGWGKNVIQVHVEQPQQYQHNTLFSFMPNRAPADLRNLSRFVNLEKCTLKFASCVLRNGQILSHLVLKELYLEETYISEDIIVHIRKFRNLEKLYLVEYRYHNSHSLSPESVEPISLDRLQEFTLKCTHSASIPFVFEQVLSGSNPAVVNLKGSRWCGAVGRLREQCLNTIVESFENMECFNVKNHRILNLTEISRLLSQTRSDAVNTKRVKRSNVTISRDDYVLQIAPMFPPIIDFFQHVDERKLIMELHPMENANQNMNEIVEIICGAPFDTFKEIAVKLELDIWMKRMDMNGIDDELCIMHALHLLDENGSKECDVTVVKDLFMRGVTEAEMWLTPWLMFNEEKMREIGLQKLSITFKCDSLNLGQALDFVDEDTGGYDARFIELLDSNTNRLLDAMDCIGPDLERERAEYWAGKDERCSIEFEDLGDYCRCYSLSLSLCI